MAGVVTPAVGDLLADRYSLAAHIDDDSSGRQVWRGMDVLLNRPVTVILRSPGGAEAEEMLSAAVAASRVNHPNIVGVYDAVDQGDCAYIVREWVEGQSLRDSIEASPLGVDDAVDIVQCAATAVAAVHASGVAHGNVHPGTILLSIDDRVVLTDPRADSVATQVGDVRALGATLYCAITGTWPRTVPGPASLPDAPTDDDGQPLAPIEVRGEEVSHRLNRLIVDLLTAQVAPPTADELATELGYVSRVSDTGALALVSREHHHEPDDDEPPARILPPVIAKRRLAIGASGLIGLAVIGLLIALIVIPSDDDPAGTSGGGGDSADSAGGGDQAAAPQLMELDASAVQVVDPDDMDASAINDLGNVVDGDTSSAWSTEEYAQEDWGGYKEGMGLLLDLGAEHQVATIQIEMSRTGNTIGVYAGSGDLSGNGTPDLDSLGVIVDPTANVQNDLNLTVADGAPATQYLLLWCSVPAPSDGGYQWSVNEVKVYAR